MKLKNLFKMLAIALLICLSVQVSSYAMDDPEYDPELYNAAFDGMPTGIYNKDGVLVDPYDGSIIKERNTWIKFGDNTQKYEDIAGNMQKQDEYGNNALNYVRWINSDGTINKTKRYDDVKKRTESGVIRFIIKKNPANKNNVIVILRNLNTGETRKTVVPYGKKKERALDFADYKIEKMYQEGVNNEEFIITPEINEFSLNQDNVINHDHDIYLTVAENKQYKEEQKRKQEEEKKKKEEEQKRKQEEEKKKAEEKRQKEEQLKKENEEKQRKYEEKLAQQKLEKEQQKTKQKRITIAVVVASIILIAAGFVLYKKRR
ncbi:hypothetical protein [Finegoldia magna]|uniref:LPXTG-motif cell wall anchor domain protein n=1 Tax=Finegoldia magna ATCC 53516 TaxID=525282 RepID=D6S958_FINMA|nr:hypothetical protein [Finegoldia magna]EFH93336.1 hypothetical protein HMPREF0391_10994 [Finegoldia magna ATCC 53516]